VRAIIGPSGDLDSLPGKVQAVANALSSACWTVTAEHCAGDAVRSEYIYEVVNLAGVS
jgi:hypothetical protein